jgi:hypothetical protein
MSARPFDRHRKRRLGPSDDEQSVRLRSFRFPVAPVEPFLEATPELLAGAQHRESGPAGRQPQDANVISAVAVAARVGLRLLERTRPPAPAPQTQGEHLPRGL